METILLVDDDKGVLEGQENLLRLNGYSSIARAMSAAEAREAAGTGAIALVILDLTLGDGSGLEIARSARYSGVVICVTSGGTKWHTGCPVSSSVGAMP